MVLFDLIWLVRYVIDIFILFLSGQKEQFVSKEIEPSSGRLFIFAKSLNTIQDVKVEITQKYSTTYFLCKPINDEIIEKLPKEQVSLWYIIFPFIFPFMFLLKNFP